MCELNASPADLFSFVSVLGIVHRSQCGRYLKVSSVLEGFRTGDRAGRKKTRTRLHINGNDERKEGCGARNECAIDHPSEVVLTVLTFRVKSFILRLAVVFTTPAWTSSFHRHIVCIHPRDMRETKGSDGRTRSPDANAFAMCRRQKPKNESKGEKTRGDEWEKANRRRRTDKH